MAHVTYVELFSNDLSQSTDFYKAVFDWNPQGWGGDDYLVEASGDDAGVDTGFGKAEDGTPRAVPVITVDSVDDYAAKVGEHGGQMVVPKFAIPTMGYAAYFVDPSGVMMGLFQTDSDAS